MRKLILIIAVAVVGVTSVVGPATAAAPQAAGTGTIINYATSYTSPSNSSTPVHHLKPGEQVETLCFREGQVLNGNPYWFLIQSAGETAYVHRDSISPPRDLRHC